MLVWSPLLCHWAGRAFSRDITRVLVGSLCKAGYRRFCHKFYHIRCLYQVSNCFISLLISIFPPFKTPGDFFHQLVTPPHLLTTANDCLHALLCSFQRFHFSFLLCLHLLVVSSPWVTVFSHQPFDYLQLPFALRVQDEGCLLYFSVS